MTGYGLNVPLARGEDRTTERERWESGENRGGFFAAMLAKTSLGPLFIRITCSSHPRTKNGGLVTCPWIPHTYPIRKTVKKKIVVHFRKGATPVAERRLVSRRRCAKYVVRSSAGSGRKRIGISWKVRRQSRAYIGQILTHGDELPWRKKAEAGTPSRGVLCF